MCEYSTPYVHAGDQPEGAPRPQGEARTHRHRPHRPRPRVGGRVLGLGGGRRRAQAAVREVGEEK